MSYYSKSFVLGLFTAGAISVASAYAAGNISPPLTMTYGSTTLKKQVGNGQQDDNKGGWYYYPTGNNLNAKIEVSDVKAGIHQVTYQCRGSISLSTQTIQRLGLKHVEPNDPLHLTSSDALGGTINCYYATSKGRGVSVPENDPSGKQTSIDIPEMSCPTSKGKGTHVCKGVDKSSDAPFPRHSNLVKTQVLYKIIRTTDAHWTWTSPGGWGLWDNSQGRGGTQNFGTPTEWGVKNGDFRVVIKSGGTWTITLTYPGPKGLSSALASCSPKNPNKFSGCKTQQQYIATGFLPNPKNLTPVK